MAWQLTLKTRWAAMAAREQRGLTLAAVVVAAALLWMVAMAPALRTLKSAAAQNTALSAELERMQTLQARAKLLQAKPAMAPQESLKALQAAAADLGKAATLQVVGEQATLTLKMLSAQSLAQWLAPESGPGLSPFEAHLLRDTSSPEPLWSGTLIYRLPAAAATAP